MNAENMVRCGFTLLSLQPNPQIAMRLARKSFLEYGNIVKASELALFTAPFRTALDYDIPLVLFGENPALEAGDVNRGSPGWDASGIRFSNTLSGAAVEQWLCDGIERRDLIPYTFPSVPELEQWGGRGIFMGYFLNWSGWQNGAFAFKHGMQPINEPYEDIGIYYRHNSLDSNNGVFVNSYLKYLKFGFGHTTEFSSYDIRAGRLTRAEAAALVKKYDGKCHPRFMRDFCAWVGLSEAEFAETAEHWRGNMWRQDKARAIDARKPCLVRLSRPRRRYRRPDRACRYAADRRKASGVKGQTMRYCKRCVYPANHPLGLAFDERGLCTGCLMHEEKDSLDWRERGQKLSAILDKYRDPKGLRHDCIVPVSGGRDSFFIVDLLKNKYGLNPLLVTFNRHYNTRVEIFNLEQLRTRIGLDIVTLTINPERYKKLIRYSLDKRGSIHWPYLAGSTVFPVQMAVRKKIPLIVWGAHQGVDQVGMFSHHDQAEMTRRYRKEHDLMGLEPEDALNGAISQSRT